MNLHTCSVQLYITQSVCCWCCWFCCFCCYYVILLLQQQHYTEQMPIGVLYQVTLTFAVRCTQLRYLVRKVVISNEYHCVLIHQIDGVRICIYWSGDKIVHITIFTLLVRICDYAAQIQMCKLSQNIVPNVYDSLQGSFLSLAWPWSGRSLPKGNQWECWDPGLEPNVVVLPVHLPPQCP